MKKDKEIVRPNKIKIDLTLSRCKESIQTMLNNYNVRIEGYLAKMVNLKKEKRFLEADRYKNKLKTVLASQTKMNDLMDKVEQFEFVIDEAFAKNSVYNALGDVLSETNKVNMAPEIKNIIKDINKFEKMFSSNCTKFDGIFNKISKSVNDIDSTNYAQDSEIDAIVNSRLQEYDNQTTERANNEIKSMFSIED